jgi:rare lipoprotein A (peptidoglycan hydrolase)
LRTEILTVATAFLGLAVTGCAGVVAQQAQASSEQVTRTRAERVSTSRWANAASTYSCDSGKMLRSAYYWQGRRTASGEPFNPDGLTAAHRTLPFGTKLTVTNPRTGKSVVVEVNDRGPFTRGLHLDLSRGAARAIGLKGTGTVCVS